MKTPTLLFALIASLLFSACETQDQPSEEATATPGVSPAMPGEPLDSEADAPSSAADTTALSAPNR